MYKVGNVNRLCAFLLIHKQRLFLSIATIAIGCFLYRAHYWGGLFSLFVIILYSVIFMYYKTRFLLRVRLKKWRNIMKYTLQEILTAHLLMIVFVFIYAVFFTYIDSSADTLLTILQSIFFYFIFILVGNISVMIFLGGIAYALLKFLCYQYLSRTQKLLN